MSRGSLIVLLLGTGAAWNAGNVGSVIGEVSREFDLSLATVGLLSGTLLLGFAVLGTVLAPRVGEAIGVVRTMVVAAGLCVVGNLVFAVAPDFAALSAGRALAGCGLGLAAVAGPIYARATGGVRRVGLFGAAFQLGIAGGLGFGAILTDLGADWRLGFLLSAAVAASPLPLLAGVDSRVSVERRGGGFLRLALRSSRVLRLTALFLAIFAVPLTLGSWLVHYLSVDSGLSAGFAGALGFVLFGVSAWAREIGGGLASRGVGAMYLAGLAPLLAAAGLAALALDDSAAVATVAVVAAGVGFALPYGTGIVEAQKLFPREPAEPVAFVTMIGSAAPVALVPVMGSLLGAGDGEAVFLALAAFVLLAGILNLRPVEGSLEG